MIDLQHLRQIYEDQKPLFTQIGVRGKHVSISPIDKVDGVWKRRPAVQGIYTEWNSEWTFIKCTINDEELIVKPLSRDPTKRHLDQVSVYFFAFDVGKSEWCLEQGSSRQDDSHDRSIALVHLEQEAPATPIATKTDNQKPVVGTAMNGISTAAAKANFRETSVLPKVANFARPQEMIAGSATSSTPRASDKYEGFTRGYPPRLLPLQKPIAARYPGHVLAETPQLPEFKNLRNMNAPTKGIIKPMMKKREAPREAMRNPPSYHKRPEKEAPVGLWKPTRSVLDDHEARRQAWEKSTGFTRPTSRTRKDPPTLVEPRKDRIVQELMLKARAGKSPSQANASTASPARKGDDSDGPIYNFPSASCSRKSSVSSVSLMDFDL